VTISTIELHTGIGPVEFCAKPLDQWTRVGLW